MAYIGTSPSNGVRRVHTYTATASQTTFSGASSEGVTLSYADTNYLDVYQNGILLGSADYTATSGTSIVLTQAASASDLVVIVVYDVFSVADTVSKANGGTFDADVTMANNLLVGTTNSSVESSSTDEGVNILPNKIGVARDGGVTANFNRLTSDGDIIKFRKDGTTVGSIGTENGHLHVSSGDTGLKIHSGVDAVIPSNGSSSRDAAVDLGYATGGRFKDLYLSGGAYIGGTGSANYLDDYEEGSWTPAYGGSSVAPTVTYNIQKGSYVKVGDLVHVQGRISTNATSGGSGSLRITGFPFTNINQSQHYSTLHIAYNVGWASLKYPNSGLLDPNTSHITLYLARSTDYRNGVGVVLTAGDLTTGSNKNDIIFSMTYRAN